MLLLTTIGILLAVLWFKVWGFFMGIVLFIVIPMLNKKEGSK